MIYVRLGFKRSLIDGALDGRQKLLHACIIRKEEHFQINWLYKSVNQSNDQICIAPLQNMDGGA